MRQSRLTTKPSRSIHQEKIAWTSKANALNKLGRNIEANAANAKIKELEAAQTTSILDHSMASNVDESTRSVITRTHEFSIDDSKAYSWLSLKNVAANAVWWDWYSPAGDVLYTDRVDIPEPPNGTYWSTYNVWSHLDIAGHSAANLSGDWHVDVHLHGEKILREDFSIGYQKPNGPEGQPSQGPGGQQPILPEFGSSFNQPASNSTLLWDENGDYLVAQGKYNEAIQAYNKSIELYPTKEHHAWYGKGNALAGQGNYDEAIQCYDKAIKIVQQQVDYWNEKGKEDEVLGGWTWDCPSWEVIGIVECTKVHDYERDYANANNWRQDLPPYCNDKGVTLKDQKKYDEAIQAYDKAIESNPKYAIAWYNKGVPLDNQGKHDQAIQCYDKASELDPQNAAIWKANALQAQGKYDEAIQLYDKAIKLNPKNADAWYNKGVALLAQGKHAAAKQACDKVIEINPQYAKAWYNKGVALNKLGRTTNANEAFAKAKELGYSG